MAVITLKQSNWENKDMKAQLKKKTLSPLTTFLSLPWHLNILVYKLWKNGMFKITDTKNHI